MTLSTYWRMRQWRPFSVIPYVIILPFNYHACRTAGQSVLLLCRHLACLCRTELLYFLFIALVYSQALGTVGISTGPHSILYTTHDWQHSPLLHTIIIVTTILPPGQVWPYNPIKVQGVWELYSSVITAIGSRTRMTELGLTGGKSAKRGHSQGQPRESNGSMNHLYY